MRSRLAANLPIINKIKLIQHYSLYLEKSNFKVDAIIWIIASLMISIAIGALFYILLPAGGGEVFAFILFVTAADISIGMPYFFAVKRIEQVELALPDTLKQMSDILRSGGTYEYALREIASSNLGPMKEELEKILRKLEEGENFENAFKTLREDVDSKLVKRTVTIIIDAMRSGAGLAEVLEQIAEDVREMNRLARERKARTMMQVLFMVAAGGIIAPLIFGFVSTVIQLLITAAAGAVGEAELITAKKALDTIQFSIQIYLLFEIIATSVMIALMREGKISKSIIYIPMLLLLAYILYYAGMVGSRIIVGK
ncbi:MAG: type II secretion system F family protein [Candidatus Diapherotrites archaeon]